jgi:hypothetical protein
MKMICIEGITLTYATSCVDSDNIETHAESLGPLVHTTMWKTGWKPPAVESTFSNAVIL